jgi:hypothetical protein
MQLYASAHQKECIIRIVGLCGVGHGATRRPMEIGGLAAGSLNAVGVDFNGALSQREIGR